MKIKVGTRVGYSKDFLGCIGMQHDKTMNLGKGTVTELIEPTSNWCLACITWDKGFDLPDKVNVKNLRVIPNRK